MTCKSKSKYLHLVSNCPRDARASRSIEELLRAAGIETAAPAVSGAAGGEDLLDVEQVEYLGAHQRRESLGRRLLLRRRREMALVGWSEDAQLAKSVRQELWAIGVKRHAQKLGIQNWRALIWWEGADLEALRIAEAILPAEYSLRAADQVKAAWFAAGCKDSRKFRAMVAASARLHVRRGKERVLPLTFKKGESLEQFRQYCRAVGWFHKLFGLKAFGRDLGSRGLDDQRVEIPSAGEAPHRLGRQAIREFGRISAHARRLLVAELKKTPSQEGKILRGRDLPWGVVATWQRAVAATSGVARLRLQAATFDAEKAGRRFLGHAGESYLTLAPAFRYALWDRARQVTLWGRSPQEVARAEDPSADFSRAEAAEWMNSKFFPAQWLFWESPSLESRERDLLLLQVSSDSLRHACVVRWLISAWNDPKRRAALANSEALRHLDALLPEDIAAYSDGASAVWDRAVLRAARGEVGDLCALPSWARTLPAAARCLISRLDLTREGQEMSHCVGMYGDQVRSGSCRILSIRSWRGGREERSTVEISRDGRSILQHRGKANAEPPHRHRQLMAAWLRRRK